MPLRLALVIALSLAVLIALTPVHAVSPSPSSVLPSLLGFGLAANRDNVSAQTGASVNVTLTVSSQSLSGPVSLDAAISPTPGPSALIDPSNLIVQPAGSATSTLEISTTSVQPGIYDVVVTGSSLLAPSQSVTVSINVTSPPSGQSTNPPSGSTPPGSSGHNNQQPSTTTSGSTPKGPLSPKNPGSGSTFDPVGVIVAGNLLAAVATAATMTSLHTKRKNQRASPEM